MAAGQAQYRGAGLCGFHAALQEQTDSLVFFTMDISARHSTEIFRRAKEGIYYANVTYMGIRLRDRLKTINREEAQRRLIEIKLAAEIRVLV